MNLRFIKFCRSCKNCSNNCSYNFYKRNKGGISYHHKKIGLTAIIKTAVGKIIIAALTALLGIIGIPVAWLLVPIIAGILVYEYKKFPDKLAESVSKKVRKTINEKFTEINDSIVYGILNMIAENIKK